MRLAIKSLLDKGIRRINVSLAGAFGDAAAGDLVNASAGTYLHAVIPLS